MWIVDADDFCEANRTDLAFLKAVKERNPAFCITLFTILGCCSKNFIAYIQARYPWMDIVPHGWKHPSPYECQAWSYAKSMEYLVKIEEEFPTVTRGFKAPGWQISEGMYQALLERGWWVADQDYNDARRPRELRVYKLDAGRKLHFHCGCWNGTVMPNSLSLVAQQDILWNTDGEYALIKDVLCATTS